MSRCILYDPIPVGTRVRVMAMVPMGCGDELPKEGGGTFRGCGIFVGNGDVVACTPEGKELSGLDYRVRLDDGTTLDFSKQTSLTLSEIQETSR